MRLGKLEVILGAAAFAMVFGPFGVIYGRNYYIKNHLEQDAILFGAHHNFPLVHSLNLPMIKNVDLDDNGLYESVIIYKDQDGRKIYQEIKKKEDGSLVLGPKELYN